MPTLAQVEEMERVLEFIEQHQENWNQAIFSDQFRDSVDLKEAVDCGTACCFGGWSVLLAGQRMTIDGLVEGTGQMASEWAIEHLGLPTWWCREDPHIFDATNTLEDLHRFVAQYRVEAEEHRDHVQADMALALADTYGMVMGPA